MKNSSTQILLQKALSEIPMILGHQDLNSVSPTYGCFDRVYWGWRLKDISDASLQYAVYPLALAWSIDDPKNTYFQSPLVQEAVTAGCHYWLSLLHRDGSCDQSMPYERSVGVTAYVLLGILSAHERMSSVFDDELKLKMVLGIKKSAQYVFKHHETYGIISNHLALIAFLLAKLSIFLEEKTCLVRAQELIALIQKHQSAEGWFLEYNGADPGYQTQCLYYLAAYYQVTHDVSVLRMIEKAITQFSVYFVHPDGSLGGEYGCRRTEIYYPAVFHIMTEIPEASSVALTMLQGIEGGHSPGPNSLDFANSSRLAANYLVAFSLGLTPNEFKLPCQRDDIQKYFPEAGLYVLSNKNFFVVFGPSRGGVIKIFDRLKKHLLFSDCGWSLKDSCDVPYVTNAAQKIVVDHQQNYFEITGTFYRILQQRMTVFRFIALRILSTLLGLCSSKAHDCLKKMLVKFLISKRRSIPVIFCRRFSLDEDLIQIEDTISLSPKVNIKGLSFGGLCSGTHMASAQFEGEKAERFCLEKTELDIETAKKGGIVKLRVAVGLRGVSHEVVYAD